MKIRIRPSFAAYVLILAWLSGIHACIGLMSALAVHEGAHAFAAKLLKEPIASVEFTPFGGIMYYKSGHVSSKGAKGVALALAGPLGNYITVLLISTVLNIPIPNLCTRIMKANLTMMILNLLPALPFDGGSVLFSLGYYLFDVSRLIGVLSFLGVLIGAALCALTCAGMIAYKTLNISLLFVGVYVFCYAKKCRCELLTQNIYAIMCERVARKNLPSRITCFQISGEEPLYSLTPLICQAKSAVFLFESDACNTAIIGEREICHAMLKDPFLQVKNLSIKQENRGKNVHFPLKHPPVCDRIE